MGGAAALGYVIVTLSFYECITAKDIHNQWPTVYPSVEAPNERADSHFPGPHVTRRINAHDFVKLLSLLS